MSSSTPTPAAAAATPPRNNYAAPHTPIASAKRPRSSLERGASAARLQSSTNTPRPCLKSPKPPPIPPPTDQHLSPMHKPRPVHRDDEPLVHEEEEEEANNGGQSWVGRQVDALFSPVLSFLNSPASKEDDQEHDPDVTMDETVPAVAATETTTQEDEDEEDDEDVAANNANDGVLQQDADIVVYHDELHHDYSESSYEEDEEEFNPYLFIKSLPKYDAVKHLRPGIALPPKSKNDPPISLVLDLDETLVHCTVEPVPDADLVFPVVFHGTEYQVHVRLRPHLETFLKAIRGKYEVIVFTASQKVYANELLDRIDPDGLYIQHRMFRESCLALEGNFLKDLNVLGRNLKKTVLVDNSPHAFGYQVDNGIPIESWFDDPTDSELLKLASFLDTLHDLPDVKAMVRHKFQTFKLIENA